MAHPILLRLTLALLAASALFGRGTSHARDHSPVDNNGIEWVRDILREAGLHNPDARAAMARYEAARGQIPQARALPAPRFGHGYYYQKMDTRQTFRVEQQFPGFGKRKMRMEVSKENARAADAAVDVVAADLRLAVLEGTADWVFARQSLDLVRENAALVGKLEQVALRRYRAGESSQADVLRWQTEAESLKVDLLYWEEREPVARAALNALLDRPPDEMLPPLFRLPVPAAEAEFPPSMANNADLRLSESKIGRAERRRDLARRESRPDFGLGVEYMDNVGHARNEVMAMVSLTLPLWRAQNRAVRREASAELSAARWDHRSLNRTLEVDRRRALQELEDARRRLRLYEDSLIPRARQILSLLESEYRTGSGGFLDLMQAQRTLLELELALARAQADVFTRIARWERISGEKLIAQTVSRPKPSTDS